MRELTRFEQSVIPGNLRHSDRLLDTFQRHVRGRVLDFGCGVGAMMERVRARLGVPVLGVDVVNLNLFENPTVLYDGATLPFRDGAFDTVLAVFVIHHASRVDRLVSECARVCGGKFILLEDVWTGRRDRFWLWLFHVLFDLFMVTISKFTRARWKTDFHYYFRDDEGWHRTFREHGLEVVEERSVVINDWDPVKHRLYVLARKAAAGAGAG